MFKGSGNPFFKNYLNKSKKVVFFLLVYGYFPLVFFLDKCTSSAFFLLLFYDYISLDHPKLALAFFKKILLGLILILVFLIHTFDVISLDFFVSFLSFMLGLKTLELNSKRDLYILTFLISFLVVAVCLYEQDLWVFIYILVYVFLFFLVLFIVTNEYILNWSLFFKEGGMIFLYSIPLIVFLFVLFPRLPHAFLGFSKSQVAISGLSEDIMPGAISHLVLSDKVAFRIKFDNIPSNRNNLYFRCGVHEKLKHGIAKIIKVKINKIPLDSFSNSVNYYKVFLEPGSRFVPFLEMTSTRPKISGLLTYEGYFYLTNKQITSPLGYRLNHIGEYVLHISNSQELDRCLKVELLENPKTQNLVKFLLKRSSSTRELIDQMLMIFTKDFIYTLKPPIWPIHNPIDYFLFVSKRGFCEHFAVALTYMLRYAHIPARVVSGYKGGELNPLGNYLIVRHANAHAWVEAYVSELNGWLRIDPVDFIPRESIDKSMNDVRTVYISDIRIPLFLRHIISAWDYVNYKYRMWIVDYSHETQISFLNKVGPDLKEKFWFIVAFLIGFVILMLLIGIFLIFSRSKKDSVYDYFLIFLRKLRNKGIKVDITYGPVEIKDMLVARDDSWVTKALLIIELFIKIRYINKFSEEDIYRYKKLIKDI